MKEHELRGAKLAKALDLKSSRFEEKEMSKHAMEEIATIKLKDRSHMKIGEWDKR
jgi:histone arginine demethylase JMJD6